MSIPAETQTDTQPTGQPSAADREQRRFQVSSNRGAARHRVRYLETGGAAVDTNECTFCQVTPDLDGKTAGCEVVTVTSDVTGTRQD